MIRLHFLSLPNTVQKSAFCPIYSGNACQRSVRICARCAVGAHEGTCRESYRTKGGHWRVRAFCTKDALVEKIRAITRDRTRQRTKPGTGTNLAYLGLLGNFYRANPRLIPPTAREVQERNAVRDALGLELVWRAEDPLDSPTMREYKALPFGKKAYDDFIRKTVRPEALQIVGLSSVERHLVVLIIGQWKVEVRITATWLAAELNMTRRDFYRHPVTRRWKRIAAGLICNAAEHEKLLARQCGRGFSEQISLLASDDEIDLALGWKEP